MGFLKRRLDAAKIIDPEKQSGDQVLFGARVSIEDEDGTKKTWTIIGEDEADPSNGRISWKSPVGQALMYKYPGDLVTIRSPSGERDLTIVEVTFPKCST